MSEQIKLLSDYIKELELNKRNLTAMDKICFSQWYHENFDDMDIINVLYRALKDKKLSKTAKNQILKFVTNGHNGILRNTNRKFSVVGKGILVENLNFFLAGKKLKYNWLSEYDLDKSFSKYSVKRAYRLSNGERFEIDRERALAVKDLVIEADLFPSVITVENGFKEFGENGNIDDYILDIYENIKSKCDKYVYTSKYYYDGCMFKRNKHLVDNSKYCICYLTKKTGGTAFTVNYAFEKGLVIYNIHKHVISGL